VNAAYYAQHVAERLKPEDTVLQALSASAHKEVRQQEILDIAGALLFSGDNVKKKIKILSGGEKARVALGKMLLMKAPLLLLDEPTNHLDFYTVESLTQALANYSGTVIVVSHDRGFVRRIANKILEVRSGHARIYPGTYDEYVWSVQRRDPNAANEVPKFQPRRPKEISVTVEKSEPRPSPSKIISTPKKELEAQRRVLDKQLQDLDRKTKIIETRMAEQSEKLSTLTGTEAASLSRELAASQRKIQELEKEFLEAMEKREALLSSLKGSEA
jgi:ATP-binding cassette subfamily F protein 3